MKKFILRPTQKLKTLQRGTMLIAGVSLIAVFTYIFIGTGALKSYKSTANDNTLIATDPINNGQILCGFSWDNNDLKKPDVGPSVLKISRNAEIMKGGRNNSNGLSAGNTGKNINMLLL